MVNKDAHGWAFFFCVDDGILKPEPRNKHPSLQWKEGCLCNIVIRLLL